MSEEYFDKYTLLKRLAFGGMAEIWLARLDGEEGFRKTCVLKRILPQFSADEDFVRMFVDEAVLAARLSHPNVVQTYDFGNVDGAYFIAMEFVDGLDLRRLISNATKKGRSLSFAECAATIEEICRGLSYVHNLGDDEGNPLAIIHRDISPHNVMVSRAGQAKIMDFGIAKAALRASQTRTGTVKGKLAYMAPEQASAQPLDKRTDQFAVGLVLWECITGCRHFEGNSEPELFGKVMRGESRDVRELRPDTPAELAEIVERMLSLNPEERYPDLSDAERDLSAFRFGLGTDGAARLVDTVDELAPAPADAPSQSLSEPAPRVGTLPLTSSKIVRPGEGSEDLASPPDETALSAARGESTQTASSPSFRVAADETWVSGPVFTRWVRPKVLGAISVFSMVLVIAWIAGSARNAPTPGPTGVVAVTQPQTFPTSTLIRVSSKPSGASISIDGRDTGLQTPSEIPGLKVGSQISLGLRLSGFEHWTQRMRLSAGERIVQADLISRNSDTDRAEEVDSAEELVVAAKPVDTAPPDVKRKLDLSKSRAQKPAKGLRRMIAKKGTGRISLRSTGPWVEVMYGRKRLGRTPISNIELPAGKVTLRLKNSDAGIDRFVVFDVPRNGSIRRAIDVR